MVPFNKNWIAAGFLGVGTLSFGIALLLMSVLMTQVKFGTPATTQAAVPPGSLALLPTPVSTIVPTVFLTPAPKAPMHYMNLKMYTVNGSTWTPIPDMKNIRSGDTIMLAVIGAAQGGIFDAARFSVKGGPWLETTQVNQYGEYYYPYTVTPEALQNFSVNAQIHHNNLGWL